MIHSRILIMNLDVDIRAIFCWSDLTGAASGDSFSLVTCVICLTLGGDSIEDNGFVLS